MNKPLARTDRIITEEVSGECVIYDGLRKKAHTLNSTLTWIWDRCDGQSSIEEIAEAFEQHFNANDGINIVASGLKQLEGCGLLQTPIDVPEFSAGAMRSLSRRAVVTTGSVLLPAIISVLAPTAAAAKSKPDDDRDDDGDKGDQKHHHHH